MGHRLALASVVAISLACGQEEQRPRPLDARRAALSSGTDFSFLPPLASAGLTEGPLDTAISPEVRITDGSGATVAKFTGDVRVDPDCNCWHVNWPATGTGARLIRVFVGSFELGKIDVFLTTPRTQAPSGTVGLNSGRTVPIKFFANRCAAVVCAGSDQCHAAGVCDPSSGACSNPARPDGTSCDDGNLCTVGDACKAGACTSGAAMVCQQADACHAAGSCDPSSGACVNPPAYSDGTPCAGANLCETNKACQAGVCSGGTPTLCATDVCAAAPSSCNPATGSCEAASDACATVSQDLPDELDVAIWDYNGNVSAYWWTYEGYQPFDPMLGNLRKVTVDQTLVMTMGDGPGPDTCTQRTIFFGPGLWTGDAWECLPNTTYTKQYHYNMDAPGDWVTPSSYYPEARAVTTPFHYKNLTTVTYHYFPSDQ